MAKATVLAKFEDVKQKLQANALMEMEYDLLVMQLEKLFRDTYYEEKFVKYGLKQEKWVLTVIEN